MLLYRTIHGPLLAVQDRWFALETDDWDALLNTEELGSLLGQALPIQIGPLSMRPAQAPSPNDILAPIGSQEVWAAGVTYRRSREARMSESRDAGGDRFYDLVYDAERPEIFFKATPHRVVGPEQRVRLRRDSHWNVPEPELALVVNRAGRIIGYTIGNDMSSRDIERENPLYLPQAKIWDGCCALGPAILLSEEPLPSDTLIRLTIERERASVFAGSIALEAMHREPASLVEFLFRDNSFPAGCILLTGTGIVPPDDFTLRSGDVIRIEISPIGTLINRVQ